MRIFTGLRNTGKMQEIDNEARILKEVKMKIL